MNKIYNIYGHLLFEDPNLSLIELIELNKRNLAGVNLIEANLCGASLTGANLYGANLTEANLTGANLIEANLCGASLTGANLYGANLTEANLTGANLIEANLTGANLTGANLSGANLFGANLTGANLTGVNLTKSHLYGTDLGSADLIWTCLDPRLHKQQRDLSRSQHQKGLVLYRTRTSQVCSNIEYIPGHTYTAHYLSFSVETQCHPGIYAGTLKWMVENFPKEPLVKIYVRAGDYIICSKGCVRCKRIRVLEEY